MISREYAGKWVAIGIPDYRILAAGNTLDEVRRNIMSNYEDSKVAFLKIPEGSSD